MNIKIFCRCSLFPSWSGQGLISTPVFTKLRGVTLNKTLTEINNLSKKSEVLNSHPSVPYWQFRGTATPTGHRVRHSRLKVNLLGEPPR